MSVKFGVFVPQGWRTDLSEIADPVEQYEAMTALAKVADSIPALDSIWVYDHFHTIPTPKRHTTFEAWTTTAALTRDTKRVNVGQMVTCNGYRNPALLAKMASTVDVMSHGRLYFGLGAGWYHHEWVAYGYKYPETRERMRAFREACQIVTKMWTEDEPEFKGEFYHIEKPINEPKGVRKPHPSFWIGGGGEQVTLKLVAQYGDACNFAVNPETAKHKLGVLRQHCETVGRDYESITKSVEFYTFPLAPGEDAEKALAITLKATGLSLDQLRNQFFVDTYAAIVQRINEYTAAGVNYIILNIPELEYGQERLHRFVEEVIPHVEG